MSTLIPKGLSVIREGDLCVGLNDRFAFREELFHTTVLLVLSSLGCLEI